MAQFLAEEFIFKENNFLTILPDDAFNKIKHTYKKLCLYQGQGTTTKYTLGEPNMHNCLYV